MPLVKIQLVEERRHYFRCPACYTTTNLPYLFKPDKPVKCRGCKTEYDIGRVIPWRPPE